MGPFVCIMPSDSLVSFSSLPPCLEMADVWQVFIVKCLKQLVSKLFDSVCDQQNISI